MLVIEKHSPILLAPFREVRTLADIYRCTSPGFFIIKLTAVNSTDHVFLISFIMF